MEIKPINVLYAPGTFGNCLRWLLDKFTGNPKLHNIDSPWDSDNRVHGFENVLSGNFPRAHQQKGLDEDGPKDHLEKIIISFDPKDMLFIERCGFHRDPGNETDTARYKNVVDGFNQKFISESFGNDFSNKHVAKEIMKIKFHNDKQNAYWNSMLDFIRDERHQKFDMYSLWDTEKLALELDAISNRFALNMQIDKKVLDNVTNKIKNNHVVETKGRADEVLRAISEDMNVYCGDLDIVEQAYIETVLEKKHDSVLFPFGTNWFSNSKDIVEFLKTYPTYLKHMNPRLPWYNGNKNPFYLTGQIDRNR